MATVLDGAPAVGFPGSTNGLLPEWRGSCVSSFPLAARRGQRRVLQQRRCSPVWSRAIFSTTGTAALTPAAELIHPLVDLGPCIRNRENIGRAWRRNRANAVSSESCARPSLHPPAGNCSLEYIQADGAPQRPPMATATKATSRRQDWRRHPGFELRWRSFRSSALLGYEPQLESEWDRTSTLGRSQAVPLHDNPDRASASRVFLCNAAHRLRPRAVEKMAGYEQSRPVRHGGWYSAAPRSISICGSAFRCQLRQPHHRHASRSRHRTRFD